MVVGLHLPQSATITGLTNRLSYDDQVLPLSDRTLRLVNATIDTWNLYPQKEAQVTVRNCLIGELIAQDSSRVDMEGTIVDGTGGYFGASQNSFLTATGCLIACDVQAVGQAGMAFHQSQLLPYYFDETGAYTFLSVFDTASIHLDQTFLKATPVLGRCLFARPEGLPPVLVLKAFPAGHPLVHCHRLGNRQQGEWLFRNLAERRPRHSLRAAPNPPGQPDAKARGPNYLLLTFFALSARASSTMAFTSFIRVGTW
ncbi:MAG: hypothetical protein WCB96_05135 [Candidatus Aminicenantales bacterium]